MCEGRCEITQAEGGEGSNRSPILLRQTSVVICKWFLEEMPGGIYIPPQFLLDGGGHSFSQLFLFAGGGHCIMSLVLFTLFKTDVYTTSKFLQC